MECYKDKYGPTIYFELVGSAEDCDNCPVTAGLSKLGQDLDDPSPYF